MRSIPALALLFLAGCHSSSDSGPKLAPLPVVVDLGLAAQQLFGAGRLRLVAVPELRGDLDGDGDAQDVVLQVLDLEHGSVVNTGVALAESVYAVYPPSEVRCSDTLVAAHVSERDSGRDLDGDGMRDEVLSAVFERGSGTLVFLPFAHERLVLAGDTAAFVADAGSGRALHVFDARDGSLASPALEPSALLDVRDGLVVFTLAERGAFDLNQDGDALDTSVVHVYDVDTRAVVNTAFTADVRAQLAGGFVGFDVFEAEQGGLDLDGDGDALDRVFVALDPRGGVTRMPGFQETRFEDEFESDGTRFLLSVSEANGDRNGDGDTLDRIQLVYEPRSEQIIDPGVASSGRPHQAGRWLGFGVAEFWEGVDLDGDGELFSTVPHVLDTLTGSLVSLGFRGEWVAGLDGHLLGLHVVGGSDFVAGAELFSWSARDGSVRMTGLDPLLADGVTGDRALFHLSEDLDGSDLNRDGDHADLVLAFFDGRTRRLHSLGLAVVGEARLEPGGRAAVLVSEEGQGVDLDGDGQLASLVVHTLALAP